eukprot:75230_1
MTQCDILWCDEIEEKHYDRFKILETEDKSNDTLSDAIKNVSDLCQYLDDEQKISQKITRSHFVCSSLLDKKWSNVYDNLTCFMATYFAVQIPKLINSKKRNEFEHAHELLNIIKHTGTDRFMNSQNIASILLYLYHKVVSNLEKDERKQKSEDIKKKKHVNNYGRLGSFSLTKDINVAAVSTRIKKEKDIITKLFNEHRNKIKLVMKELKMRFPSEVIINTIFEYTLYVSADADFIAAIMSAIFKFKIQRDEFYSLFLGVIITNNDMYPGNMKIHEKIEHWINSNIRG